MTRPGIPDRLYRFVKAAWSIVEPAEYVDNWHIRLICAKLEAVTAGEIKQLIINVPPGTSKSLLVSVFWPAWEWALDPSIKWMYASYDQSLAARHARFALRVIQSPWYKERFDTRMVELAPAATDYENTDGGFRFSTSVAGKATGRHVRRQIVDDSVKPSDTTGSRAVTKTMLRTVSEWWKGTMSTRRDDAVKFSRVIVAQRLHEDDLPGEMLREGGWHHLCLPMRYEANAVCVCGDADCSPEDPRTEEGELLCPERYPEEIVRHDEAIKMGAAVAAAQLQQRPTPAKGGIFEKGWFRFWHHRPGVRVPTMAGFPCRDEYCQELPKTGRQVQSWDFTFKGGDGSDFVAGGAWLQSGVNCYLIDQVNKRMGFVESVRAMVAMTARHPLAITKYVEDKANGSAIQDVLKAQVGGIVLVNPQGGKEARAHAVSGLFEAGNIYLPHPDLAPWVGAYMAQVASFPRGVNDDMVDQTTQALIKLAPGQSTFDSAMQAVRAQNAKEKDEPGGDT